eukprot:gene54897-73336_t
MSMVEKRAVLRASKVKNLPRPREGSKVLDDMLLDIADDAVRREVLRLRALNYNENDDSATTTTTDASEVEEDTILSVSVSTGETKRQSLLRQMGEALDAGDMEAAE